ncbi:MAG TPA: zinc ribbon domain-containing protein [Bacilli bacterium]|nr:zinc ribbon domain-containing protein [Bacilli bacterium]
MICKNCNAEISETANYCPYCGFRTTPKLEEAETKKQQNLPSAKIPGKIGLLIGFFSVIISLIPLNKTLIISGIILGLLVLIFTVIESIKHKHKLSTITIIVAAIGLASNISWLLFITYVL